MSNSVNDPLAQKHQMALIVRLGALAVGCGGVVMPDGICWVNLCFDYIGYRVHHRRMEQRVG